MEKKVNLFLLGATGGIGSEVIRQALRDGHRITAFARSPQKIKTRHPLLRVEAGDPLNPSALNAILPGHDAVISALGPRPGSPHSLLADAAAHTVAAMQRAGVSRLLIVSAALLFPDSGPLVALVRSLILRNVARDCSAMERVVTNSNLTWTIARPPRLTNGPLTNEYRILEDHSPKHGFYISRADVADFLLRSAQDSLHLQKIVGLAR